MALPDNDPTLSHMKSVFQVALDGTEDPTGKATHYVNLDIVTPAWIKGATKTAKIGHHTFYKDVK
jgi:N-acetylmuramoyl-L-alanine amidase